MTLDPGFGPAYAGYAETIYYDALFQYREYDAAQAMRSARKAVELDSEDANARVTLGRIYRMARNPEAAVSENKMAIELNPSLAEAYHGLGSSLAHSGRAREAVPYLETAIRLSPRDDLIGPFHVRLALAHLLLENHDQAVEIGQRAVRAAGHDGEWLCLSCRRARTSRTHRGCRRNPQRARGGRTESFDFLLYGTASNSGCG